MSDLKTSGNANTGIDGVRPSLFPPPARFDWLGDLTKETNRASSSGGSARGPEVHSAAAASPALQATEVTR
jgi:hypothetical protein